MKIPCETYVELYSTLAEKMLACSGHMDDYIITIDETELYTDEGQELFNHYCDVVCSVLDDLGIEKDG